MINIYLTDQMPDDTPLEYHPDLIPAGKLVHSGIFSPDMREYYFTISDTNFTKFDVLVSQKEKGKWKKPTEAIFNSPYSEHGTSFSADGKYVYFSSTRPIGDSEEEQTWKLWRLDLQDNNSEKPVYMEIKNFTDKLISHPTLSNDGTLYFHAGNRDYSDLNIYRCLPEGNGFSEAVKLSDMVNFGEQHCTPFIARDESYLIFESSGKLFISYKDENDDWSKSIPLNKQINRVNRGNPFITPDGNYLIYASASEENPDGRWQINWVLLDSIITPGSE